MVESVVLVLEPIVSVALPLMTAAAPAADGLRDGGGSAPADVAAAASGKEQQRGQGRRMRPQYAGLVVEE